MKKVVGIILFVAASMAVTAQNTSLGPTIGVNGWTDANNKAKVGVNFGATFTYSASAHWAFGADLKYSMEGGGKTVDSKSANITEDYIRVPLKIIYFFGERGQKFRPKLYAGPSFGFLTGGTIKATYFNTPFQFKSMDYLQHFDAGLLVGTGFNYRLSKGTWLNVDLGYTGGLSNIINGDNGSAISTGILPSMHNHNLALNVGVAFPLGTIKSNKTKKK